jgi:hypothetical protein
LLLAFKRKVMPMFAPDGEAVVSEVSETACVVFEDDNAMSDSCVAMLPNSELAIAMQAGSRGTVGSADELFGIGIYSEDKMQHAELDNAARIIRYNLYTRTYINIHSTQKLKRELADGGYIYIFVLT